MRYVLESKYKHHNSDKDCDKVDGEFPNIALYHRPAPAAHVARQNFQLDKGLGTSADAPKNDYKRQHDKCRSAKQIRKHTFISSKNFPEFRLTTLCDESSTGAELSLWDCSAFRLYLLLQA